MLDLNDKNDEEKFELLYAELEKFPQLAQELSDNFFEMDGCKGKDELSRCMVFFMLGRLYEQKYGEGSARD